MSASTPPERDLPPSHELSAKQQKFVDGEVKRAAELLALSRRIYNVLVHGGSL